MEKKEAWSSGKFEKLAVILWLTTEEKDGVALAEHLKLVHKLDSVELFNLSVELFNLSYTFTVMQLEPRNIDKCEQNGFLNWSH